MLVWKPCLQLTVAIYSPNKMHSLWGIQSRVTSCRKGVLFINSGSNEVVYQYVDLHTFCQNPSSLNSRFSLMTAASHPSVLAERAWKQDNRITALLHCIFVPWRRGKFKGGPIHIFIIAISSASTEQNWYWLSHLKWLPPAWIWVLLFLCNRLLLDSGELLPVGEQLLLELLLRLGLQEPLSEGDVGEHSGKRSAKFNRRLGTFLKKKDTHLNTWSKHNHVSFYIILS